MGTFTKDELLELFVKIKTDQRGRKNTTKGLSQTASNNFKKLVKRKYGHEDFEKVINQMFNAPDQWAVNSGNDTLDHILVERNFDNYLNAFENAENLKKAIEAEKKEARENKQDPKITDTKLPFVPLTESEKKYEIELLQKSKDIYTESLGFKRWLGGIMDAVRIGALFTDAFTLEEKLKIDQFVMRGGKLLMFVDRL